MAAFLIIDCIWIVSQPIPIHMAELWDPSKAVLVEIFGRCHVE